VLLFFKLLNCWHSNTMRYRAMVTKIWDSASNNEMIVQYTAKGLDRYYVRQNIAYPVIIEIIDELHDKKKREIFLLSLTYCVISDKL